MSRRNIATSSSKRSLASSLSSRRGGGGGSAGPDVVSYDLSETPLIDALKLSPRLYSHFRNDGYIHVSDVLSKCLRQIALLQQMKMSFPAEQINDGVALTYKQGDAIHDFLKQRFIAGHKDHIFGDWTCACGATEIEKTTLRAAERHRCDECNGHLNRYKECRLVSEEYGLSGSPDISLRYSAMLVGEFKSMASALFDELNRPVPDHILQAVFYWKLYKLLGYAVYPVVSILYVKKDWTIKLPYKEYLVDATANEKRLDSYLEDLQEFAAAKKAGGLPARVVCPTIDAPAAKKCPVCVACFNRK